MLVDLMSHEGPTPGSWTTIFLCFYLVERAKELSGVSFIFFFYNGANPIQEGFALMTKSSFQGLSLDAITFGIMFQHAF